jgi:putative addiction module component (TIGR02574 family)
MMSSQTQAFVDAALSLPEAERILLVEQLLESISPEQVEMSDGEFLAELERRSADFERGTADAIPWSELKKED